MAKLTWICAGCDGEFDLRKIDQWRMLHVEISSRRGPPRLSETFELCPDCQNRLVNMADPRKWPRSEVGLSR